MSNQFGHNRDRRRQSQMQAAASGLAALGRQAGSASQFGGGRPIQQHPSLAGSVAGSTVHGASAAAVDAYGSIDWIHATASARIHWSTISIWHQFGAATAVF